MPGTATQLEGFTESVIRGMTVDVPPPEATFIRGPETRAQPSDRTKISAYKY